MPAKCQQDVMKRAYEVYQNGNLIEAKTYVDSAMTFQSLTIDPSTCYDFDVRIILTDKYTVAHIWQINFIPEFNLFQPIFVM